MTTATAPEVNASPEMYTAGDLARKARVSEHTVRKLARAGLVPGAVRVGTNRWRFNRVLADRWLSGGGVVNDPQARG